MSDSDTLQQWMQQLHEVQKRQQANQAMDQEGPLRASTEMGNPSHLADMAIKTAGKSGREVMQMMLEGVLHPPRISKTLDFHMVEVGDGLAIFQGTPAVEHFNPLGTVHGGWFATLLDSALGCSVHTKLPPGKTYTTSQINVNIVRAAHVNTGPLRAIGHVVHMGRQVATSEAKIVGPDGKLYAHATSTCFVFDAR